MATLRSISMILIWILMMNCNSVEHEFPFDEATSCEDAGKFEFQVENRSGALDFSDSANKYFIRSVSEGSYDEVIIAFICNPTSQIGDTLNANTDVVFSGDLFKIKNSKFTGPVGTEFYYMILSEIKLP
ncbi:hypothetical protein [Litoribacter populi]|uniref:hypothetical protein n=1 Tax=Litoribacter populi TaxID=2598460 RepID=UPI00117E8F13|nr:hypothetical protein [Litoribacter populi]